MGWIESALTSVTFAHLAAMSNECCRVPEITTRRQGTGPRATWAGTWLLVAAFGLASTPSANAISILKAFPGDPSDGSSSVASLISDGAGNLYGTTTLGGASDNGTVFTLKTDGSGFTVLHSFEGGASDGSTPEASLILDGAGNLYGTTAGGGASNQGTVFTVKIGGTGFAILHGFSSGTSDGANPYAAVVLDGAGNLYGTTLSGGTWNQGTVFRINTDGTGFAVLDSFGSLTQLDGAAPQAALILDGGGYLYGTTTGGGASAYGAVFRVKTDGTAFAVLHSFASGFLFDGAAPQAALVLDSASNLYGTTPEGGDSDNGAVFKLKTDGSSFSILHSFEGGALDGLGPYAALVLDASGDLYGTTTSGGASDTGTVFKLETDGSGFSVLYGLAGLDGANPYAGVILDGAGELYGTTFVGGATLAGTVFSLNTDGTGFAVLHTFNWSPSEGASPHASLLPDSAGSLYGTTVYGGASGGGTVFTVRNDGTGFVVLHSFAGGVADGSWPYASLILDDAGYLYGTTELGGASLVGTVFRLKTDGSGFTVLLSFEGGTSDGANPDAALILDGAGNLYGTTTNGGTSGYGTVFRLRTDGTGCAVLHNFMGGTSDGANPDAALVLDGAGNLYGTSENSGASGFGTVFKLKTDGSGFALLHSFAGPASDGVAPEAPLILDGAGNLYGTTRGGGATGYGTVFRLRTDGTSYALLHSFIWSPTDGASPYAPLLLDGGGMLLGTTLNGGKSGGGTVFGLKTDGTGYTLLHSFPSDATDGVNPYAALILDGAGNLYGTTSFGGGVGTVGTVFSLPVTGDQPPTFSSASSTTFLVGVPSTFTVTATGYPAPTITCSGALPAVISFTDNGNGTATLAGTPAAGSAGTYPLTLTAHNGVGADAVQSFTLQVSACISPSIATQPQSQSIQSGETATLTVTATGTAPLSYQWYQGASGNTSTPVGTEASSFTTPQLRATTIYWVRVSNACGHADSATATISLGSEPRRHLQRVH